jgi:hypothetical protein
MNADVIHVCMASSPVVIEGALRSALAVRKIVVLVHSSHVGFIAGRRAAVSLGLLLVAQLVGRRGVPAREEFLLVGGALRVIGELVLIITTLELLLLLLAVLVMLVEI